jgi:hypothetical protein
MYLAEIHGKLSRENENKEDILTSNVFSFFKYANREIFLYRFLKYLGLNVTPQDAARSEFSFWPSYPDGTQPDLVIMVGDYYLLVEAKYHSKFGQESNRRKAQLVREIEGGAFEAKSLGKIFKIIPVTAHYYKIPDIFNDVPEHYQNNLIWINWQSIAYLVYSILDNRPPISEETYLFAEDLYSLFLKKNLRNFEGVNVLSAAKCLYAHNGEIFFDARTAEYRGDFIGFISVLEQLPVLNSIPVTIFYPAQMKINTQVKIKRKVPMKEYRNPTSNFFEPAHYSNQIARTQDNEIFYKRGN